MCKRMKGIGRAAACLWGMASCVPGIASSTKLDGATVFVNESPVLTFRHGTAATRAKPVVAILKSHNEKPNAKAVASGARAIVMLGNRTLLRVEVEDAQIAGIPPLQLAKVWAGNINKALSLPSLHLGSQSVQIGNGKETRVPLSGRLAANASVESSDESIVSVKRVTGYLALTGRLAGTTQVAIAAGGQNLVLNVTVVPIAAIFPQYASASVTGIPATGSIAKGAVEAAVWNQIKVAPGAEIKFTVPEVGQIPTGGAKSIAVRVFAQAPEAQPSEGVVHVTVRNQPRIVEPESELWYDNVPESIDRMGQLFGGRIQAKKPVRILYHHDNDSPRGVLFHSQIVNASDRPAQILLIPGDSPTDPNPILAGVVAADRFFRNWLSSSGEIVTIPPKSSLPISMRRLAPKATVSGLIYVSLLEGGPESIMVRSDAKATFQADGRWATALSSDYPWRIVGPQPIRGDDAISHLLSEHVFPLPFRNLDVTYSVGGRHGFVRIGQQPIASATGDRYLDGNFGVVYTIRAFVENTTTTVSEVELVYEASAGYAGALFAVNGQVISGPMLKPKGEARILKVRMEPGSTKTFVVQTIPHSGGSYPATLALRPVDWAMGTNHGRRN